MKRNFFQREGNSTNTVTFYNNKCKKVVSEKKKIMENKKITDFFQQTSGELSNSDSDTDTNVFDFQLSETESDFLKFQKILETKEIVKQKTKIVLIKKSAGGSMVWNYFGQMVIENKPILQKFQFYISGFKLFKYTYRTC